MRRGALLHFIMDAGDTSAAGGAGTLAQSTAQRSTVRRSLAFSAEISDSDLVEDSESAGFRWALVNPSVRCFTAEAGSRSGLTFVIHSFATSTLFTRPTILTTLTRTTPMQLRLHRAVDSLVAKWLIAVLCISRKPPCEARE